MTSKEALDILNNFIPREKHIDSERNKKIKECYELIEKDLERLEKLKKPIKIILHKLQIFRGKDDYVECWKRYITLCQVEYELLKEVLGND